MSLDPRTPIIIGTGQVAQHAIATMANELRAAPGTKGFIWGNGGFTTKHSFGVYSTEPSKNGFRFGNPQSEIDALPMRDLAVAVDAQGPATIEAYTVMHNREGAPETAYAACLLADGKHEYKSTRSMSSIPKPANSRADFPPMRIAGVS